MKYIVACPNVARAPAETVGWGDSLQGATFNTCTKIRSLFWKAHTEPAEFAPEALVPRFGAS